MRAPEKEQAAMSYTLTVTVKLEGITAPLQIHAETVNDLRKQVQQLQALM